MRFGSVGCRWNGPSWQPHDGQQAPNGPLNPSVSNVLNLIGWCAFAYVFFTGLHACALARLSLTIAHVRSMPPFLQPKKIFLSGRFGNGGAEASLPPPPPTHTHHPYHHNRRHHHTCAPPPLHRHTRAHVCSTSVCHCLCRYQCHPHRILAVKSLYLTDSASPSPSSPLLPPSLFPPSHTTFARTTH